MITLIGTSLAKKGLVFIFYGGSSKCESCRFNRTCLNLEKGRKYIITNVKKVHINVHYIKMVEYKLLKLNLLLLELLSKLKRLIKVLQ